MIAVIDNGMYGTIRMHQEREYPTKRVHGTELKNPDFAALRPRVRGASPARRSTSTGGVRAGAARGARCATGRRSSTCGCDADVITSRTTLAAIRAKALERAAGDRAGGKPTP